MKQDSRVMRSGWVSGSAGWDIAQHRQNYHKYQELAFQGPTAGILKIQVPAESLLTSLFLMTPKSTGDSKNDNSAKEAPAASLTVFTAEKGEGTRTPYFNVL